MISDEVERLKILLDIKEDLLGLLLEEIEQKKSNITM